MFTKRKLEKFIDKSEENNPIDKNVLLEAKKVAGVNNKTKEDIPKNKKRKMAILVATSCVIIIVSVGLLIGLLPQTPSAPPKIYYSYQESQVYPYESAEKYALDTKKQFEYFNNFENCEENVAIYKDKEKDVLLQQRILLLNTYEVIKMYVELENNYVFDFLGQYDNLENQTIINNRVVEYKTTFDDNSYLYVTIAKFEMNNKVYRVQLDFEQELSWFKILEDFIK